MCSGVGIPNFHSVIFSPFLWEHGQIDKSKAFEWQEMNKRFQQSAYANLGIDELNCDVISIAKVLVTSNHLRMKNRFLLYTSGKPWLCY